MKQIENITKNWKVNEQFSQIMHYKIYEGTELFLKNEIVKAIRAVGYLGPKEDREEVLKALVFSCSLIKPSNCKPEE